MGLSRIEELASGAKVIARNGWIAPLTFNLRSSTDFILSAER
jgi:hypothetical protein